MSLLVCSLEVDHTYPLILYCYRSFVHWIRPAVGHGANKQMTWSSRLLTTYNSLIMRHILHGAAAGSDCTLEVLVCQVLFLILSSMSALVGQSVVILDQLQFLFFQTRMPDLHLSWFSLKTFILMFQNPKNTDTCSTRLIISYISWSVLTAVSLVCRGMLDL
jgi:hypothetical protein